MAKLTLTIDAELLKQARIRAFEQGTSLNALVRDYLEGLTGQARAPDPAGAILELARGSDTGSGAGGRTWTRGELYER
jgi:hypothetical protein